jgi:hypothetical protein
MTLERNMHSIEIHVPHPLTKDVWGRLLRWVLKKLGVK